MYRRIADLSQSSIINGPYYTNDPLTYCLGNNVSQRFNHGSNADIYGQNSKPCQAYLSQYCANNWDGICETTYNNCNAADAEYSFPADPTMSGSQQVQGLTSSDILLLNTAYRKYLYKMHNCDMVSEPFDPLVAASPIITSWRGMNCVPEYVVDPDTIDDDPVMNRLLLKPWIAKDLFRNIHNNMKRLGTLPKLRGTRLGRLYGL